MSKPKDPTQAMNDPLNCEPDDLINADFLVMEWPLDHKMFLEGNDDSYHGPGGFLKPEQWRTIAKHFGLPD